MSKKKGFVKKEARWRGPSFLSKKKPHKKERRLFLLEKKALLFDFETPQFGLKKTNGPYIKNWSNCERERLGNV